VDLLAPSAAQMKIEENLSIKEKSKSNNLKYMRKETNKSGSKSFITIDVSPLRSKKEIEEIQEQDSQPSSSSNDSNLLQK